MSPEAQIKALAAQAGFSLCGIASVKRGSPRLGSLTEWLAAGHHAEMAWMERQAAKRLDPGLVLEGCQSILSLGLYHDPGRPGEAEEHGIARVARYARGQDYHKVMEHKLKSLESMLAQAFPAPARFKGYADTGPVSEKAWAAAAGLGWQGKNTCLINEQGGSYLLLAEVLTTLSLSPDEPALDRCGSCQRCLEACPTQALVAPGVLDARRCVSYLTIEHKGALPQEFEAGIGENAFGCDLCQEVCPWNRKAPQAGDAALKARPELERPSMEAWLGLDAEGFKERFKGTALRRAKLEGLQRNACVVKGNLTRSGHAH